MCLIGILAQGPAVVSDSVIFWFLDMRVLPQMWAPAWPAVSNLSTARCLFLQVFSYFWDVTIEDVPEPRT